MNLLSKSLFLSCLLTALPRHGEGWNLRDFGCTRRLLREAFKEHASDKLRDEAFKAPQDGRYSHRAGLWCKMLAVALPPKQKHECMIAILTLYRKAKARRL